MLGPGPPLFDVERQHQLMLLLAADCGCKAEFQSCRRVARGGRRGVRQAGYKRDTVRRVRSGSGSDSDDLARRPTWVRIELGRRRPRPKNRRRRCHRLPVFMHADPVLMVLGLVGAIGDGMSTSVMLFITSCIFNFLSSPLLLLDY